IFTLFFFVIAGRKPHSSIYRYLLTLEAPEEPSPLAKRSWKGWDERAETERCYRQERIATLLAFWLGVFGVDQWYARHWVLAVFKMVTFGGMGVWIIVDINLWIVGGYYSTHGCRGGHMNG